MVVGVGDVGLEAPAALVLRLGELLEPGAAARALGAVGGVAALVGLEGAAGGELVDAVDDGVEEAAVVGDDEQGAVEAGEELLEPGEAVGVEVVGRLVEEQHLRVLEQRRRQQRARLLAARQPVQRPVAGRCSIPSRRRISSARASAAQALRRLGALEGVGVAVEVARRAAGRRAPRPPRRARRGAASRASPRPRAPPARGSRRGRRETVPRSGRSRPASRRSSVDLPAPLGPTRPARSPALRVSDSPSNRGAPS